MPDQVVTFKYVQGSASRGGRTAPSRSFSFRPSTPGEGSGPGTRKGTAPTSVERLHEEIQRSLYRHLVEEHGSKFVACEHLMASGRPADIVVKTVEGFMIYEIKTAGTAKDCVRQAVGQLLEYAYWPGSPDVTELWVVGPAKRDTEAETFLADLRSQFGLPIRYQRHDMGR